MPPLESTADRPLRVLLMVDHLGIVGGAERLVEGLAAYLPRDRVNASVVSTRTCTEQAAQALAREGIPHLNLGRSTKWDVHRFRPLVALLRRGRFDVLHAHKFGSNLWGSMLGRACGVPVVIAHEHTWSYTGNPVRMWLDGRVIGLLATRFVAVSGADGRRMIELEKVSADKVVVMRSSAYVPHQPSSNGGVREELALPGGAPLIAVAAGLRKQKALDVLVAAHARLRSHIPDAHLVIAGEGPCQAELEAQVQRLGTGESVHFLGRRRDIDSILGAADVAAMSSDFEGMPLFVFECMAASTPLVATAVGGLPEIIDSGHTGLLVPPRDPAALAQALERVLTDRAFGERLASASASRLEHFTIDAVARGFADLYEQLVAEVRGGG